MRRASVDRLMSVVSARLRQVILCRAASARISPATASAGGVVAMWKSYANWVRCVNTDARVPISESSCSSLSLTARPRVRTGTLCRMGTGRTTTATEETRTVLAIVQARMDERHLSQPDLARLTGIPQTTISKVLRGQGTFTVGHLLALCSALEILPSDLLRSAGQ